MKLLKKIKSYIKAKKYPYYMCENKKYKNFDIGEYTYGKPLIVSRPGDCSIGKFCSIAAGVKILVGAEHQTTWVTSYNFEKFSNLNKKNVTYSKGKVSIGNDVWIGEDVFILSGVTIGDGAVIGARSVVSKDVKPYEIVAGNPIKHIRFRFSEEEIQELLKIQWWNWSIEKIQESFDLMLSNNIDQFIEKYKV